MEALHLKPQYILHLTRTFQWKKCTHYLCLDFYARVGEDSC